MRRPVKIVLTITAALGVLLAWAALPPATAAIKPVKALPADFIWGVSSSGFQSEGGDLDSYFHRLNKVRPTEDRYGKSVDFMHRYREDIALAKDMGINTYRIGIDWTRVEPRKGQFDEAVLSYYDHMFRAMKDAGIAPLITLHHFDHPGWVEDQGAWTNPQTTKDFVDFVRVIATRHHDDVHLWITFNEASLVVLGQKKDRELDWKGMLGVRDNMVAAHRQAYDVIHGLDSKAMVTSNIVWFGDHFGSTAMRAVNDWLFLDGILDKVDTIAIDYYAANLLKLARSSHHWQWPTEPPGLYRALKTLSKRYPDKPILIAETGMATENGKPREDGLKREDVLRDSIYWTQRAHDEGVNVIGFMVWSLTDNFEWGSYTPRFGLCTVNALTDPALKRIATAAVPAYRQAIHDGGMTANYQPVVGN